MFRNIFTLLTGTALAQLVGVLLLVPLAWLYGPGTFGAYAIFQAIVTVGVAIASLRYDVAIVLAPDDAEAKRLLQLSSVIVFITALIIVVSLFFLQGWLVALFDDEDLAAWIVLAGASVFLSARLISIQYWLTRTRQFWLISQNRVVAVMAVGCLQLLVFTFLADVRGLILGAVLGQGLTLIILLRRVRDLRIARPRSGLYARQLLKRYKKMPLLNGPNAILDELRTLGINLLMAQRAFDDLGQYSLAWRVTMAPASLIQGAVAQVLLQRLSVAERGTLFRLVSRLIIRLAIVALPLYAIYYFLAPWLIPAIFGPSWAEAGLFAQALIPWVFMLTFTTPLSNVYIVTEQQQWMLLFAALYAIVPLLVLALSADSTLQTMFTLGGVMAGLLSLSVLLTIFIAIRFDAGA